MRGATSLTNYAHMSAPETFLAYLAGRTTRIGLGHGVVCLPPAMNHPIKVAERVALLDILSGGRVRFGVGKGGSQQEAGAFGYDLNELRPMIDESMYLVPKMFVQDEIEHDGQYGFRSIRSTRSRSRIRIRRCTSRARTPTRCCTTGRPKGVMTAHGQNLRAAQAWATIAGVRQDDRYLIVNPFFHTFGYKAGWLAALSSGATVLPHLVFQPDDVLRRVADERVSVLPGPPTLYYALLDAPERVARDLSSLRVAVTGAAAIAPSLIERMRARNSASRPC
ncbi:UNVERIFIED_ORG: non-ribosomal peptide synthetase component E (peptide arylation enzyme) [Burkholderia contaminans]|nr:non-ribosomal peptide synthetase component E (peptide arylation enzyme) [Burkholderia contaminans]